MQCRHNRRKSWRVLNLSVVLRDAERRSEQSLGRGCSERNDQLWMHGFEFRVEPWSTGGDLLHGWLFVDAHLAARLPLEVLDRICDIDFAAIDLSFFKSLV